MKGISINGNKLHEIMMPCTAYDNCNSIISMLYPKNRIAIRLNDDRLKLTVPSRLALEMYRVGVLPQDDSLTFSVSISGKSIGKYKVVDFLHPNSARYNDNVFITMYRQ